MAYIDDRNAYGAETNIEDIHEIHYYFSVNGFIYTESLYFSRVHETMCLELPTTWEIGVQFQRSSSSKNISCSLSIKRIDTSYKEVIISSMVRFYNSRHQQLGRALSFSAVEVRNQQKVQRTSDPVLSPIEMASLIGQELRAIVTLKVIHCHRIRDVYDPITSLTMSMDKMLFQK